MTRMPLIAAAALLCGFTIMPADDQGADQELVPIDYRVGGRADCMRTDHGAMICTRQWPGTYFETAFEGDEVTFWVDQGAVHFKVSVDGVHGGALHKPERGLYGIRDLEPGHHTVRIDVISESQGGKTVFGGFHLFGGEAAPAPDARARQMEFIGDSHTVGYGNTSPSRDCTEEEVWSTTDTSQGFGALLAARYRADYQVNAISGRGIVRNYNGGEGATLPEAYPYVLFDKADLYGDEAWKPGILVIALGTNDFSTPLNEGEPWADQEALRADYRTHYAAFLTALRGRHPDAHFVVWNAGPEGGEKEEQVRAVVKEVMDQGETRISFVPIRNLAMTGCHWHPDLSDNRIIAERIAKALEAAGVWVEK